MEKAVFFVLIFIGLVSCKENTKQAEQPGATPPMGWNSWDSYGLKLNERTALANMDAFAQKLKPFGYEYFVFDAGWYNEEANGRESINLNKFGIFQPSETYFPNGIKPVIDHCHKLGLKFGLHLMRGIPRLAVKQNLPVEGANCKAADIADTNSICLWSTLCYGVNMSKPGAQEYYNSMINQMADWGVDFIKYDDIVLFPEEVNAVVKAIEQCGRPILLSLSPGDVVDMNTIDILIQANMLRVTQDIWDNQVSIDKTFIAMHNWQGTHFSQFWIDMDMIPFGQLRLDTKQSISKEELAEYEEFGMGGPNRWSKLNKDQMYTFITQRAICASPLMVGGDLISLDDFSLKLLTNKEMIQCNQNGVMGKMIHEMDSIEVWETPQKNSKSLWVAIFNRSNKAQTIKLTTEFLMSNKIKSIYNIWNNSIIKSGDSYNIAANGVLFLKVKI